MVAILKNRYDVITPPSIIRLLRNLAGRSKMICHNYTKVKMKPEVEFQYGGRGHLFSETVSSFNLSRGLRYLIEFGMQIDFYLPKRSSAVTQP